jgi:hypothetical protein
MARMEGEILIGQPVDVVFDYIADQSNEPQYNPHGPGGEDHPGTGRNGNPVPLGCGADRAHR